MQRDSNDPEYQQRVGAHLIGRAQAWGWDPADGEGPFEYVTRLAYQAGIEDLTNGQYAALSHKTEYLLTKQPKKE